MLIVHRFRSVSKFTMKDFEYYMDERATILVFVKNYNCRACMEDRWYVHKTIYNFMLRKNVQIIWISDGQFYVFETIAGELPEFDKEFEVSDDTEYPQFYLFTDGNRLPRYYENSESLV